MVRDRGKAHQKKAGLTKKGRVWQANTQERKEEHKKNKRREHIRRGQGGKKKRGKLER